MEHSSLHLLFSTFTFMGSAASFPQSERLCWKEGMAAEDAVNTSIQQCLEQGREDGEQFCHRVKCLCHECSKSIFRQSRSCLRQMVNGQPGLWAQEGSWFYPDVFPCTRRTWQCFTISSCGNAALGGSWIQSGAVGPVQGLMAVGQSIVLYWSNFRKPHLVFGGFFFLFRTTGISTDTEQTFKPINSLLCLQ